LEIIDIIKPFRLFTNKLQMQKDTTMSLLLPGLMHLISSLQEDCFQIESIKVVRKKLVDELYSRFVDVLNVSTFSDPVYIASSILDCNVSFLLFPYVTECAIFRALKMILERFTHFDDGNVTQISSVTSTCKDPVVFENPFGFGTVRVTTRIGDNQEYGSSSQSQVDFDVECTKYLSIVRDHPLQQIALNFWDENKCVFPQLFKIAMTVLPIPATSAAVERLFSQLTLNTTGHKASSKSKYIKRKVLLSFNQDFIKLN